LQVNFAVTPVPELSAAVLGFVAGACFLLAGRLRLVKSVRCTYTRCGSFNRLIHKQQNKDETPVQRRKRIEAETREDLAKSLEHLLADVHDESVNASPEYAPLTRTMARFASLLCAVSEQADVQTRRVIRLTRWLIGLTWVLGFLTVGLLAATLILLRIASHTDERVRQIYEIAEQQRNQNQKSTPEKDEISR